MKKFAVIGKDIKYSLSPKIHDSIFDYLNIKATYKIIDVNSVSECIDELKTLDGFNVTKPFKQEVTKYLTKNYSPINAVNTVSVSGKNMVGYNTDIAGFSADVTSFMPNLCGCSALVIGAGGASKAVCYALKSLGANVCVTNRTHLTAQNLATELNVTAIEQAQLHSVYPRLIINCTTLGLGGEQSMPQNVTLDELRYAYDTIYAPSVTPFLEFCKNNNIAVRNGTFMLVYQAIYSVEKFLKIKFTKKEFNEISNKVYKELL